MGEQGITGLPFTVFSNLIIGFLIFGVVLQASEAGKFFMNIALCLMGRSRGVGQWPVFQRTLWLTQRQCCFQYRDDGNHDYSMRKTGYPAAEAAAVECCASTGGVLMPPVMGSTAFIMAAVLNIPYLNIALAATIPAVLFYFSLVLQTDLFAAHKGIKGWPKEEIPSFKQTMLEGWPYIFAFAVLVYCLIYLRIEAWAPFLSALAIIVIAMFRAETRFTVQKFIELIQSVGEVLTDLAVMIAAGLSSVQFLLLVSVLPFHVKLSPMPAAIYIYCSCLVPRPVLCWEWA